MEVHIQSVRKLKTNHCYNFVDPKIYITEENMNLK